MMTGKDSFQDLKFRRKNKRKSQFIKLKENFNPISPKRSNTSSKISLINCALGSKK